MFGCPYCFCCICLAGNRQHLLTLAEDKRYENPRLHKLHEVLQNQFQELKTSRGIVFTRTRQSAHSLFLWIEENQVLLQLGIKAGVLTGAGNSIKTKHMTQVRQRQGRRGTVNPATENQAQRVCIPIHSSLWTLNTIELTSE